jgi:hypothetical protein
MRWKAQALRDRQGLITRRVVPRNERYLIEDKLQGSIRMSSLDSSTQSLESSGVILTYL